MTPAQKTVYDAVNAAIARTGKDFVAQGEIGYHMSKLPHPNTLLKLVKMGKLERNTNVVWAEYRPA